jgi:hypothetical protein
MPVMVCVCGNAINIVEGSVECPKCKKKFNVVKLGQNFLAKVVG